MIKVNLYMNMLHRILIDIKKNVIKFNELVKKNLLLSKKYQNKKDEYKEYKLWKKELKKLTRFLKKKVKICYYGTRLWLK